MSMELIALIGIGVALATLILNTQRNLRADMRAEFKAVRAEIQAQREETQAGFKAVREEMKTEFKAVREETKTGFKAVRAEIQAQREAITSLPERMAHLEGLLEGLREAITGRRVAVAEAVAEDPGQYGPR